MLKNLQKNQQSEKIPSSTPQNRNQHIVRLLLFCTVFGFGCYYFIGFLFWVYTVPCVFVVFLGVVWVCFVFCGVVWSCFVGVGKCIYIGRGCVVLCVGVFVWVFVVVRVSVVVVVVLWFMMMFMRSTFVVIVVWCMRI